MKTKMNKNELRNISHTLSYLFHFSHTILSYFPLSRTSTPIWVSNNVNQHFHTKDLLMTVMFFWTLERFANICIVMMLYCVLTEHLANMPQEFPQLEQGVEFNQIDSQRQHAHKIMTNQFCRCWVVLDNCHSFQSYVRYQLSAVSSFGGGCNQYGPSPTIRTRRHFSRWYRDAAFHAVVLCGGGIGCMADKERHEGSSAIRKASMVGASKFKSCIRWQ